ncbi:hypothetical protein [Dolichospermum phage Dfl-JY45]
MPAFTTPGRSVRLVLAAQITGVSDEHIHEEGAPQVVDVRLTEAAMAHLAGLATWLTEASPLAASAVVINLDPRDRAPIPGGERIPPPCFRGGAVDAYTSTGNTAGSDPLDGHCEADEWAKIVLRLDVSGDVEFSISALPYKQKEPGVLGSEPVSLREIERLFAAALELQSPVAFTVEALDRAADWDLLGDYGHQTVNYAVYNPSIEGTTSFEDVEAIAIEVQRVAGLERAPVAPTPTVG